MKKSLLLFMVPTLLALQAESRITTKNKRATILSHEKKELGARVYFSNEIPVDGIAKEGKLFYIQPGGNYLYVIVDNYPSALNHSKLKVNVYKTENLLSVKTDEKIYDINGNFSYTYLKYNFYQAGWYNFDVYSIEGDYLGTGTVEIKFQNPSYSSSVSSADPYANSRVYFSTNVPLYGVAKDIKSFKMQPGGGYVYVIVDNYPHQFKVKSLNVYVYKYVNGEYVKRDAATYTMNGKTDFTWFKYDFYESGDYKFVVYDAKNRYVNTGLVSIGW